jgi:hypothetical protein
MPELEEKQVEQEFDEVDRVPNPDAACGLKTIADHEERLTALENQVFGKLQVPKVKVKVEKVMTPSQPITPDVRPKVHKKG